MRELVEGEWRGELGTRRIFRWRGSMSSPSCRKRWFWGWSGGVAGCTDVLDGRTLTPRWDGLLVDDRWAHDSLEAILNPKNTPVTLDRVRNAINAINQHTCEHNETLKATDFINTAKPSRWSEYGTYRGNRTHRITIQPRAEAIGNRPKGTRALPTRGN